MGSKVVATALALEGVSRRFGSRTVVDAVSFAIPAGRVTVLVGPSGCGKTTLLRMIAGIERLSAGRILLDGREVAGPEAFVPPERRRIGLMFQDYALFPHLSALDNVVFGLGHVPRGERRRIAQEAIVRVGLAEHAGQRPGQLSGGEQQRLALARALAPAPRVLLMDEPFSNLDRGLREEVRTGTLAVLREAQVTTLVVTHDPEEALAIGDQLVLLGEGRVIQAGPASSVYARPASIAAARALSDINLLPARWEAGALVTPLGPVRTGEAATLLEGDCLVGFRPEHIAFAAEGEGVPGRVRGRVFRGASTLLSVAVEGMSEPLRVAVPSDGAPEAERVGLVIASHHAMVFAGDTAKATR